MAPEKYYILAVEVDGIGHCRQTVAFSAGHARSLRAIRDQYAGGDHPLHQRAGVCRWTTPQADASQVPIAQGGTGAAHRAPGGPRILLGPGVFLRLGDHGALRMLDTRLENAEVEVQQGTSLVEVVQMPNGSDVHVVSGPTRTGFKGIGLHRFEAGSHRNCACSVVTPK